MKKNGKTSKFMKILPKWVKTRWFAFFGSVVLAVFGAFFLLCMDRENTYRPDWLNIPFFREYIPKAFGLYEVSNISMFSWFVFFIGFGALLIVTGSLLFYKFIKNIKAKDYCTINHCDEYPQSEQKKYTIKFVLIVGSIAVVYVTIMMLLFTVIKPGCNVFTYLSKNPGVGRELLSLAVALGLLIIAVLIVPVSIAIVAAVLFGLVKFISLIVGGVTSTVVSSARYQEASTNTQIVQDRIRAEVDAQMVQVRNKGGFKKRNYVKGISMEEISEAEAVFPGLSKIDSKYPDEAKAEETAEFDFAKYQEFAKRFQAYLANKCKLYYKIDTLRAFVAGLSASRLVFLEGLSGTGKTTLPREFMKFVGGEANFFPVQASWRDKTDVLGYYSDLTYSYKESEILLTLYEAGFNPSKINMMVLDEMNIARPEYYFADFLSVFEYPSQDWKIKIIQPAPDQELPKHLEEGYVRIPTNTWFVGTLNIDDSTYTLSDKIYDRCIAIDFEESNLPFTCKADDSIFPTTVGQLEKFFELSRENNKFSLSKAEEAKFNALCEFVIDTFEVKFGNRILKQIENFVPVYVALGGSKNEALDHMFASKILRKLDTKYESYMDSALVKLEKYVTKNYGAGHLKQTEALIRRYKRRFN